MRNLYRSKEWLSFRSEILKEDGHKCCRCGRMNSSLQVHHKRYMRGKKPWEYDNSDCETLCKRCHAVEHGLIMPSDGWEFIAVDDLGELDGRCDACGTDIRYEYSIFHPKWADTLTVGEFCCERLTGTTEAAEHQAWIERLQRFSSSWVSTETGESRIYFGIKISLIKNQNGYALRINEKDGKKIYATAADAKSYAFSILQDHDIRSRIKKQTLR